MKKKYFLQEKNRKKKKPKLKEKTYHTNFMIYERFEIIF